MTDQKPTPQEVIAEYRDKIDRSPQEVIAEYRDKIDRCETYYAGYECYIDWEEYLETAIAMAERVIELETGNPWHTIDTVPTDETRVMFGCWLEDDQSWDWQATGYADTERDIRYDCIEPGLDFKPTHWKLLDARPPVRKEVA